MKKKIQSRFDEMAAWSWFSSVGTGKFPKAKRVSSWAEAAIVAATTDSENAQLGRSGDTTEYLNANFHAAFQKWNRNVDLARPYRDELLVKLLNQILNISPVERKAIEGALRWDLNYLLVIGCYSMELEGFTDKDAVNLLYSSGYFPCGWEGNYPIGKIVIF